MKKIQESSKLKQSIFNLAMKTARQVNHKKEHNLPINAIENFQYKIFDKIVFKGIREKLGGNLRFMAAGGAAVNIKVLQFFEDIGIPICEGYGLTETSPVITSGANNWTTRRLGCVGVPLEGVDVKILLPGTTTDQPPGEVILFSLSPPLFFSPHPISR